MKILLMGTAFVVIAIAYSVIVVSSCHDRYDREGEYREYINWLMKHNDRKGKK